MYNDLIKELGQNFIEYAVAVNSDRAIPDSKSGLKPVAKRILYGAFDEGYSFSKPHVKCANIVGKVMADWHPHGDSSIYGALVRLAQPWVMRYPLIDFHGSMGNRDGDGPAAYRYTEARLAKISEDGMLAGIKKDNVDFIPNYSETKDEPVTLPAIFPNLLCNPNTGIGVAIASNWLCHNLCEVAQAIYDYMDNKEPMLPGPDFPTGGLIINKKDIPMIMKTGKGSVKVRGKYKVEKDSIVFYELPYGVATEAFMTQIGEACEAGKIKSVKDIRNESNRKNGFRLVIECEKGAPILSIVNELFKETDLQTSISYNQVALIDKTPTELNLKDSIKIYVDHNIDCIKRETEFDLKKAGAKLEVTEGLLKALEDIDNIIALIKASASAATAKTALMEKYNFTEPQAKAIVDMKLGRLAGLERIQIETEKQDLLKLIDDLNNILANPQSELRVRLGELVRKYGDERRTELVDLEIPKEEKEKVYVEPEKCVVMITESGLIKRIPTASFKVQKRAGKGVKTQDDITKAVIRTNTVDSLMVFTNQGKMYRLSVNDVPVGTNSSKGTSIKSLIEFEPNEEVSVIYSIYKDTDAKYVFFVTKNGIVKKTTLEEYVSTKKKTGIAAINLKDGDSLAAVMLVKDEDIILASELGQCIRFSSIEVGSTGRATAGVKGINLNEGDRVISATVVRDPQDEVAIFLQSGLGKKMSLTELPVQKRGGKGLKSAKDELIASIAMVNNDDTLLLVAKTSTICIAAKDLPSYGRSSNGNQMIKTDKLISVSKV